MDYCKIGKNIRAVRKSRALSQEELAERVNISVTHMSHIETGNTKLSLQVFADIADALDVSADEILGRNTAVSCDLGEEISEIFSGCDIRKIKVLTDILRTARTSLDENV